MQGRRGHDSVEALRGYCGRFVEHKRSLLSLMGGLFASDAAANDRARKMEAALIDWERRWDASKGEPCPFAMGKWYALAWACACVLACPCVRVFV